MTVPKKVNRRILDAAKRYRPIVEEAKARDVNEADTVTIVKSLLSDVFGWDPFFEVTSEYQIRGTYVDLAVQHDERIAYLIEVKAIGSDLRENHLRQAINYAANQGVEWVVLTNGAIWQGYRVSFGKPIDHDLVFELDFLAGDAGDPKFRERAFLLTKEGMTKSAIVRFHERKQAMSRFNVAAVIREEAVLQVVRRELRRAFPKLNPSVDQIRHVVLNDVLKREVVEGERADTAFKKMKKADRPLRKAPKKEGKAPAGGTNP